MQLSVPKRIGLNDGGLNESKIQALVPDTCHASFFSAFAEPTCYFARVAGDESGGADSGGIWNSVPQAQAFFVRAPGLVP